MGWAREHGLTLDPEQELVLAESLGVRDSGRWQTLEVGLHVPRQNGKGEILIARELFGLFVLGERLIIHTAHEFKTSAEHFARLESIVRNNEDLDSQVKRREATRKGEPGAVVGYRYSHGEESITLQDDRRIEFKTRTKSGMRGFASVDLLVLECSFVRDKPVKKHLELAEAMHLIRKARPKRAMLTHLYPEWDELDFVKEMTITCGVLWTLVGD